MPHKVLWSCRGLANLPSLPIGEFTRLKWESVDAKVNLFNTLVLKNNNNNMQLINFINYIKFRSNNLF